jgi:hypothetical protein
MTQTKRLFYSSTLSGIGWLFWVGSLAGQVQAPQGLGASSGSPFQGSTGAIGNPSGLNSLGTNSLGLQPLGTTGTTTGQPGIGQGTNQPALGSTSNLGILGVGTGNFFYPYNGNPLYEGWPGNLGKGPGGWALPLYQNSALGITGSPFNGLSGLANINNSFGGAPGNTGYGRRPAYITQIAFPVRHFSSGQVQAELRNIIARSSALSQPDDIQVNMDGQAVVLKGEVTDNRERRLVESMMRLTPGVHEVRNQLKVKEVLPAPRRVRD